MYTVSINLIHLLLCFKFHKIYEEEEVKKNYVMLNKKTFSIVRINISFTFKYSLYKYLIGKLRVGCSCKFLEMFLFRTLCKLMLMRLIDNTAEY